MRTNVQEIQNIHIFEMAISGIRKRNDRDASKLLSWVKIVNRQANLNQFLLYGTMIMKYWTRTFASGDRDQWYYSLAFFGKTVNMLIESRPKLVTHFSWSL